MAALTAPAKSGPAPDQSPLPIWQRLAPLPDREGFAGVFAGVAGRSLIVAGGANFPGQKPWEGGVKFWSDRVFVLSRPSGEWRIAGALPRPLAYGVSITVPEGLVCIGGSDAQRHYREAFVMNWNGEALQFKTLPSLPRTAANLCGARLDDTLYVAGGLEEPGSAVALKTFWSLDLGAPETGWQQLEPWPGPERMLAVAGVHAGSFFLFSGAALKTGPDGKIVREWLRDALRYTPGEGWTKLPDLPRPAVAAPSPAPAINGSILVLGGDDSTQVDLLPTEHRGFPGGILAHRPESKEWQRAGDLPFALVTTPTVLWDNLLIVPGGESRPGIRSTEVWALPIQLPE